MHSRSLLDVLLRYGADLEMNTNLLLEPQLAKADLDIKLSFQKQASTQLAFPDG